jgi:protocatechuate 3,4-dioxygenase beta subunit
VDDDDVLSPVLERRQVLRSVGALGLFGLGLSRLALARTVLEGEGADPELEIGDLLDDAQMRAICVMTPGQTQGPYYLNLNLVRSDITEGLPGARTRLWIYVVQASNCAPIPNASVDLWHCDSQGRYSGVPSQGTGGQTFLRGVQFTDANGLATFETIYPGWYPGRTTHIHVKARPPASAVLTSQMYFKQALSNRVYARTPYSVHGPTSTTNSMDGLFLQETVMSVLGLVQGVLQLELTIGVA